MKKHWSLLIVLPILTAIAVRSHAGTIFYQAIPANQSDAGSGISTDNQYTSAVDGGNTRGTDRAINGITLYSLNASGQSSTADNCTINGLVGTLSNAGGNSGSVQADGAFRDVLSDMTFNNGASDGSQQEIVLDPDSLEQGVTYDLRIYVCNSSGQNRMVNLSFVGDGQAPVETGFFNEDDATTSAGGFKDKNQSYYIDYRFTWDGDSTPGITVTQKSGSAPFVLYALTNQLVPGGGGGQTAQQGGGGQVAQQGGGDQGGGDQGGGEENLSNGQVNADSDDQVGVSSDDFYGSDSLNSNGRWCNVQKYGKCWQPTNVPQGWCPYTNGTFENCDECGATFVSDEPWAWACYHYGRWCKVSTGCGWCWSPGTVWAGAWVSWRKGTSSNCSCIGWAPLPPDVGCGINVGINSSIDYSCGLGPECYTFVNVWDFGRESYFGCGCVLERSSYVNIITETTCITNICYGSYGTYCGGVDFHWCNEQIRMHGGRECENIHVNRYDDPGKMGGKGFMREGKNSVGMLTPHVKNEKNPKHDPKTAENIKSNQVDKGWKGTKGEGAKNAKNHIAQDGKGKLHEKTTLPKDVQDKVAKNQGQGGGKGMGGNGQGGGGNHPGGHHGKNQGNGGNNTANNQGGNGQGGNNQGGGNKVIRNQDQTGGGTGGNNQGGGKGGKNAGTGATGFDQHPGGKNKNKGGNGNNAMNQGGNGQGGNNQGGGGKHPGQRKSQGGMNAGNNQGGGQGGNNQGGGGGGKGGKNKNQGGNNNNAANDQGVGNQGGGGKGGKNKNQGGGNTANNQGGGQGGNNQGGGKGGKNKNQGGGTNNTTDVSTPTRKASVTSHPTGATGATDTGGQAGNNQGGTGGGGSSGGKHHNKGTGGGGTTTGTTNQGTGGSSGQHHNKSSGGGGNASNTNQGGGGQTSGGGGTKQHHNQGTTGTGSQTGGTGQGGSSGQHHMNQGQSGGGQQQHHGGSGGGGGGQGGGQGGGGGKGAKPKPSPKNSNMQMSDLRVKQDISFMGWSPKGIPIYQFSYINQPNKRYQGTIAQAIARSRPDAIIWRNGIMWVDYSRLDIRMEEVPSASVEDDGH